jgi:hypothetical protein
VSQSGSPARRLSTASLLGTPLLQVCERGCLVLLGTPPL